MVLGSTLREPLAARRAEWLRAGLETLERGSLSARRPEGLLLFAGMLLQVHAERDPETVWPGGVDGLWADAERLYQRAAERGSPDARALAEYAHDALHER